MYSHFHFLQEIFKCLSCEEFCDLQVVLFVDRYLRSRSIITDLIFKLSRNTSITSLNCHKYHSENKCQL